MRVQIAGEVAGFAELDWIDPQERKNVSRAVPLAIAASTEALADAGLEVTSLSLEEKRKIGVILGTGGGAQDFSEDQYRLWLSGKLAQVSVYSIPSGTMGTMASEISMRFGFRGLSHVVTTGCTSSTDALGYAMRQIQYGGLPVILAGGVDAPIAMGIVKGFALMRVITPSWNHAPERASRPFSADRDGFVLGEGAWMFLVEELDHARARGAHIYAEIAGYGSTCEAFHRVRLEECGEEPARAIQLAIEDAGLSPEAIDYVNLHGTSTQLNDRVETRALKLAFGADRAPRIPSSALKSLIGHPQGASGAAGVAATLAAMQCGSLPPTLNLENPDPECDLDYVPDVGRRVQVEHAVCNCIAFGSKNSALLLRKWTG
jgi:3-oxoacyl-[acyl-carrier-protein] synthase II